MFNLKNNPDLAILLLRIGVGGFMLTHGIPKLMKLMSGDIQFGDPIGIGVYPSLVLTVFAEVFCAALILIGFKSRFAAIPLIITMVVAAVLVHGADPFGKKEMALLYLMGYLAIFFIGSGKYSVDGMMNKE